MKKQIAYFDFDDKRNYLLNAGQAKATYEVCRRLARLEYAPTVYCSRYPGSQDRLEEGIYYKHIGIGTKNLKFNNLIYIFAAQLAVLRIKADVIVECFTAPVTTLLLPIFNRKIPVVAIPTSFEADRFSRKYHLSFHWWQNRGLRFYRHFLPYSQYFVEKMAMYNSNFDYQIVPQGFDQALLNIKPHKKRQHILFLGRLDIDQKGIDLLLKAYKKLSLDFLYPLVVAGNGPDEEKVETMINDLGLSNRVKMVGPAYGKKKEKILSNALFCVVPSRHEGFCIFALESLSAGIPIVCFDIPGLSWLTDEVAIKSKKINSISLAKSLKAAAKKYSNQDYRKYKKFAKSFSWDNVADKYDKYFSKLVENKDEKI